MAVSEAVEAAAFSSGVVSVRLLRADLMRYVCVRRGGCTNYCRKRWCSCICLCS